MKSAFRSAILFCLLSMLTLASVCAEDWPQWRGPNRDGASRETGLIKEWPEEGPVLVWTADRLGLGFSSVSVVGNTIYTMGNSHSKGKEEWVREKGSDDEWTWQERPAREWVNAFDAKSGEPIWATAIAPVKHTGGGSNPGPRSTPTVDGNQLYTLGMNGDLVCLSSSSGKVIWQKNLVDDLGGKVPQYGYSESVLVDGNAVLCTPGGEEGTVAALNKNTGRVIWKCKTRDGDEAAYSSLIMHKGSGDAQYVTLTSGGVVAVDPAGKVAWRYDKLAAGDVVNIPTCLSWGKTLFGANGSVGGACFWWQPEDGEEAKEIYLTKKMRNFMGGLVLLSFADQTYLFGCSEPGYLVCMDYKTGTPKWFDRTPGKCSIVYADGNLYCRNEDGNVYLVQATYSKFVKKGTLEQPERSKKKTYTPPVVANGRLYLRDQYRLFCYDLTGTVPRPPKKEEPEQSPGETQPQQPSGPPKGLDLPEKKDEGPTFRSRDKGGPRKRTE